MYRGEGITGEDLLVVCTQESECSVVKVRS